MEENKDIGLSLINSVGKPIFDEIGSDLSEVVLDSLLDDGILRDVPIVGTILGMSKAAIRLNDYLFTKKVIKFLTELGNIPTEEKEKFFNNLKNKKRERELGEALILYLDRHENFKKPELLAKVFKAYIQHHLTNEQFHLLAASIDKALVQDIEILVELVQKQVTLRKRGDGWYSLRQEMQVIAKNLYGAGLSKIDLDIDNDRSLRMEIVTKVRLTFVLKPEAELLARAILKEWD